MLYEIVHRNVRTLQRLNAIGKILKIVTQATLEFDIFTDIYKESKCNLEILNTSMWYWLLRLSSSMFGRISVPVC